MQLAYAALSQQAVQEWDKSDLNVIIIMKGDECKEFCAGGDIKGALHLCHYGMREKLSGLNPSPEIANYASQDGVKGYHQALRFLQKQYTMNHLIATLDTPIVSIINGKTCISWLSYNIMHKRPFTAP